MPRLDWAKRCIDKFGATANDETRDTVRRALQQRRRGNILVEFALGFGLIATLASGGVVFGLALDQYNELQTAVRRGARYAAASSPHEMAAAADWQQRVQNVVVYGVPNPASGATPVVQDLRPADIVVEVRRHGAEVDPIRVGIAQYQISSAWGGMVLRGKPAVTFPYLGDVR